jgi:hypothetical protein
MQVQVQAALVLDVRANSKKLVCYRRTFSLASEGSLF